MAAKFDISTLKSRDRQDLVWPVPKAIFSDANWRLLFLSNNMRTSAPFPKWPINGIKPFSENYFRDSFQLL
jgi:hypothetical protein